MNNRVLDGTIKEKSGRTSRRSLLTTALLGLALLVGLLAQTRHAEAQTNSAPPAEYRVWPFTKPVKPPSEQDIADAVKACLEELKNGKISRDDLPKCFLKKIGRKTWNANCFLIAQHVYVQQFAHGDPCVAADATPPLYERACSDCAEVHYFCCILKKGLTGAAKCKTDWTYEELNCN